MKITKEELKSLEACQTEQDWSDACVAVKEARNGLYPPDWWDKVKLSGMMDRIMARWGADSELKLTSFDNKTDALKHLSDDDDDEDYGHFGKHLFNKRNKNN